jgi:hypothetical protein
VREARLSALRYQLNPHFLFNSLNAVSTLVLDDNAPAATRMLAQIGELLRASLDSEVMPEVALSQEIAFTERYLAIEQTRLGDRCRSIWRFLPKPWTHWCQACCCNRWWRTPCGTVLPSSLTVERLRLRVGLTLSDCGLSSGIPAGAVLKSKTKTGMELA